jgi:hypothetical protein
MAIQQFPHGASYNPLACTASREGRYYGVAESRNRLGGLGVVAGARREVTKQSIDPYLRVSGCDLDALFRVADEQSHASERLASLADVVAKYRLVRGASPQPLGRPRRDGTV